LQTPLFILSLDIELAHPSNLNVSGICSAGEKRKSRVEPDLLNDAIGQSVPSPDALQA
jgi:hypothetical protein